ncbi:HAMP domain-containing sensor histidine kinase [Streptomyces sp. GC420]|uniref:sensor histidine kinase n=1 Tax=Streptomyces sp. GC420 TaxID=2697568 RepID=UPI0028BF14EE|nr:HAMP domain-containing sensor histidine kinase [Streptomyces sp. GC420]
MRLLITSVAIAVVSVGATAWLAVQTTTRAIQEERGQVLSDDIDILRRLSGFAATHPDWNGVQDSVRTLSRTTGRRIALTTGSGRVIADSADRGTALPARASAVVDPLRTDTYTQPGAQLDGVDPRAVGPYLLPAAERADVEARAEKRLACMRHHGSDGRIVRVPGGRSVIGPPAGAGGAAGAGSDDVPLECADGVLNTPTPTEKKALAELTKLTDACLEHERERDRDVSRADTATDVPDFKAALDLPMVMSLKRDPVTQRCLEEARRTQLGPYVAPVASLYLGSPGRQPSGLDLSPANKAKIVGVTGLVLAVTVAMTAAVAIRLVRPLRALTAAARQPPQRHARVAVTTDDETGYLAAAFNDLTARRERMEAQRKAMVSDIAHELRTPLTNIRGWLEVTRDGLLAPDPGLIASLHDEALLLQHIIDDLQDLADADAGTLRLHREPVPAEELLAQVAAAHRTGAETARVRLRIRAGSGVWLDADPVRMRQTLGNLVSNAIRHTPAGGTVTLTARREDGGRAAVLAVEDTGSGIAAEDLPHVFERFWRAEKSRSRRTGGSGLGLSIVRQLAAAHDGTVTVSSEPGAGAVFTVRLPLAPAPDSPAP